MPGILEIIAQKHKETSARIAKQYQVGRAVEGLSEAKGIDASQKNAILEIAETKGFQVIMNYEAGIISKCEDLLSTPGLPSDTLKQTQIEYAAAKAKYSLFKNLADPNKK